MDSQKATHLPLHLWKYLETAKKTSVHKTDENVQQMFA